MDNRADNLLVAACHNAASSAESASDKILIVDSIGSQDGEPKLTDGSRFSIDSIEMTQRKRWDHVHD
jgi:hypothetical protein